MCNTLLTVDVCVGVTYLTRTGRGLSAFECFSPETRDDVTRVQVRFYVVTVASRRVTLQVVGLVLAINCDCVLSLKMLITGTYETKLCMDVGRVC